jgi:uncharacterized membrane protein
MNHAVLRRSAPLTILVILVLLMAACGGTTAPTATPAANPPAATTPAAGGAATVSFSKDVLPIFQKHCTRCHGGSNPQSGVSLENYQNVMNSGKVTAGNADQSQVYILTNSGVMPFGGPKLSASDEQKIKDWINEGAPNN